MSKWESSPTRGENKTYMKPPPRSGILDTLNLPLFQPQPSGEICTASQVLLLQYIEAFSLQILAASRPACETRIRRFLLVWNAWNEEVSVL